jgi:hypothetical protein
VLNPDDKEALMSSASIASTPTARQLHYLRTLALQTATSFTTPTTRREASREIDRLQRLKRRGAPMVDDAPSPAQEVAYATAVQPDEVSGFGGSTSWLRHSPASPGLPRRIQVGERTELARYSAGSRDRVLYGQRIDGRVRITDRPASGAGRSYVVERELEQDGHGALKALVADYLEQARELGDVPMASSALRHEHQQIVTDA